MINWYHVMLEMQRRQDEIASAAKHNHNKHIMRQPDEGRKKRSHIMAKILFHTGTWLVELGCRLQTRYERLALATRNGLQQDHIMNPHEAPCA